MSALDFDMIPAEAPPPPEATLEGTEPPPMPEAEPPSVKMEVKEEEGRYDEEELEDIELPDLPQKKAKLTNDEVFAPKVQPVKKPKKKRKPPTPEQLERLAEARKKAFAVRSAKKKERDEMKALEKKVAEKKKAKLEQEIIETLDEEELPESILQARKYKEKKMNEDYQIQKPPLPKAPMTQTIVPTLTQEDLRKAIAEGVEIYDSKRKAQKKVKREKQEEEQRQKEVKQKIQRAISVNPWDEFLK